MPHYPSLHRGKELSYIWDAEKGSIGQNLVDSSPYFVFKDSEPSQFGSQKYSKLQDFFDDDIDLPYIKSVSRRRQSSIATIVTDVPHKLKPNQDFSISGMGGTGYNGIFNVFSVISPTEFTYFNFWGDESLTSDTGGLVTYSIYRNNQNGIGIDFARINYEVGNSLGTVSTVGGDIYFSKPFPVGSSFNGWTFSPDINYSHYIKDSDPSIRLIADEIFFDGIGRIEYFYINRQQTVDSIFFSRNKRHDRRNQKTSYNLHVRFSFTGRIRYRNLNPLVLPILMPQAIDQTVTFNIQAFRGEPTLQGVLLPVDYNFFNVYGLENLSNYIDICPIKTLNKINQTICTDFYRNFDGSNNIVVDGIPFGGFYSTNYPNEIGDFLFDCYNSVLNMDLNCHWKTLVLPYFVKFCDAERQFRYDRLLGRSVGSPVPFLH